MGPGPLNAMHPPFFANVSARSLPSWPSCPGTQIRVTLFLSPSFWITFTHSMTDFDVVSNLLSALSTAWLSENIYIVVLVVFLSISSVTATSIACSSASNILQLGWRGIAIWNSSAHWPRGGSPWDVTPASGRNWTSLSGRTGTKRTKQSRF